MAKKKHNVSGETSAGDVQEEHKEQLQRVQIGPVGEKGQSVKGHPLKDGTVIELSPEEIAAHRDGGVPLLDVPEDWVGEVYDVHVPYEAQSSEAA